MRKIATMTQYIDEKIKKSVVKAVEETSQKIFEDVRLNAPVRSGAYYNSIQKSEVKKTKDKVSCSIYSNMLVGGDNPKWAGLPLAAFIEWGTGTIGAISNKFKHGYSYTTHSWTYYDKYLHKFVKTNGQIARPHFYPALQNNVGFFKDRIKEALK